MSATIQVTDGFLDAVDEVARAVCGPRDAVGPALAAEVKRISEVYTRRRADIAREAGGPRALAARVRFFLPRDLPKIAGPLEELRLAGAFPRRRPLRVLDLGAGVGTTTFGLAQLVRERGLADRLEVVAIDRDADALLAMERIAARAGELGLARIALDARAGDVRARPNGPFDLILLGLVLNELEEDAGARAEWLEALAASLSEDGAIVAIEPALRETSRALHEARDAIVARGGPANVFAPCLRGGGCPMLESERDWCHEDVHVALPGAVAGVAREAGLRWERLTYSYLTLRRDGRTLLDALGTEGTPFRVVSEPIRTKGKLELFVCGSPGRARLMRLDRHRGPANEAVDRADRGTLLRIEGAAPDERGRLRVGPDASVTEGGGPSKKGEPAVRPSHGSGMGG